VFKKLGLTAIEGDLFVTCFEDPIKVPLGGIRKFYRENKKILFGSGIHRQNLEAEVYLQYRYFFD